MAEVRGCRLPQERLYDVPNHLWYQERPDGSVRIGMTCVAAALAGRIVAFTPKRAGRRVEADRSCATVESGKWVGPVRSRAAGQVLAVNEELVARPDLINSDPYAAGWMVDLGPDDWPSVRAILTPGEAVAAAYETWMAAEGFQGCGSP